MKPFCALFLLAASMPAGPWNLERLFSRPYLWGTRPEKVTFPKRSHTLLFLWNAEGRRFLDLYAYDPGRQKLTRLTDLEKERDPLNFSPAERDERQKQYLAPDEGLADFDAQEDGSRAA